MIVENFIELWQQPLLARGNTWDFDLDLQQVHKELISHIPGKPWKGLKTEGQINISAGA